MSRAIRYDRLPTERRHATSGALDRLSTDELLRLVNREDARVVRSVRRALPQIAHAVRLMASSLQRGGRVFFVGAGTSGRLGLLEAAECPPTFSTRSTMVQAMIAGGRRAMFHAQGGAEDRTAPARAVVRRRVRPGDVVVGITASGVTPFVAEALRAAAHRHARTILLTAHPTSPLPAECRIVAEVGPEVLAGSTRLKAGTATKLILNMLTLGAMVRLGNTYGNLMVDVRPTSRKLQARAIRIIQTLTARSPRSAATALRAARGHVKLAVLMTQAHLPYAAAQRRLEAAHGSLRHALAPSARGR